jgi:predicted ribosomally synthesized peptide with SipW-like signal peptide
MARQSAPRGAKSSADRAHWARLLKQIDRRADASHVSSTAAMPGTLGAVVAAAGRASFLKKLMLSFMVVGAMGSAIGAGTFASFNAATSNESNSFQTGSIILGESTSTNATGTLGSSTICLSSGKTDTHDNIVASGDSISTGEEANTKDCGQFFNLSLQKPGSNLPAPAGSEIDLTVQDYGSLNATLTLAASPDCSGTLNCDAVEFMVQEYSDRARSTTSTCHYGGGTASTCAWSASRTLKHFQDNDPLTIGLIDKFGGDPSTVGVTDTRYFRLTVRLKPITDLMTTSPSIPLNDYQGKTISIGLAWTLTQ